MKKGAIVLCLLVVLMFLPLVQAQTYSGFNRFTDNVRLFFSFGDNKVRVVLDIKEKEVDSSLENFKNGNEEDSNKNLERAWKRLQFVQEKVSENTAEEVKENSNEVRNRIIQEGNLTRDFDVYVLEEEKTELTAEWIIEVDGKEGQNRTVEIEMRIDEIDDEISNWVVENTIDGEESDDGLVRVVKTEVANGDDGLKPEVKTYVQGDGTDENDVVSGDENSAPSDSNAGAPGDTMDETYDDAAVSGGGGTTAEGSGDSGSGESSEGTDESLPTD